ncbi:MAG: DUF4291 domain-containing protein [Myxococcota bacterium]
MAALLLENYRSQSAAEWPQAGRHIMAQWDDRSIVVYQAYRESIGRFAATNGFFGGDYSFRRMSWIKPNFLWMMYRSGWGTKRDQEVTLAISLRREYFDELLLNAVASSFGASGFATEAEWKKEVARSEVRLQWDPDHSPTGQRVARRAIQLGLRGETQRRLGKGGDAILRIEDISDFVATQRTRLNTAPQDLQTPRERAYPVSEAIASRIGLNAAYAPAGAPEQKRHR